MSRKYTITSLLLQYLPSVKHYLVISLICGVGIALTEGLTLGSIYLGISALSGGREYLAILETWKKIPIATHLLSSPEAFFLITIFLSLLAQLFNSWLTYLDKTFIGRANMHITTSNIALINRHLTSLPYQYIQGLKVADISKIAIQGPVSLSIIFEQAASIVINVLLCLTYLTILFTLSFASSLYVLLVGLILFLIQKKIVKSIASSSRRVIDRQVLVSQTILENLQGFKMFSSMGLYPWRNKILQSQITSWGYYAMEQIKKTSTSSPVSQAFSAFSLTLILFLAFIGAPSSSRAEVIAFLATFLVSFQRLVSRYSFISLNISTIGSVYGKVKKFIALLGEPKSNPDCNSSSSATLSTVNNITLNHISYTYPNSSHKTSTLSNISLSVSRGQSLALVGTSGSGKSTLLDIITGLIKPDVGSVHVNNVDLTSCNLQDYQARIGIVTQDCYLFTGTILENILMDKSGIPDSRLYQILDISQCSEFVFSLPSGLQTIIGERGSQLSGGQRQRVSLARALVRSPDILILDEATSALDSATEAALQKKLFSFTKNIITISVAHRLSAISSSSLIAVFDNGSIVESGTHQTLLSHNGLYRHLWLKQTQL